jgi:hypothetical protein
MKVVTIFIVVPALLCVGLFACYWDTYLRERDVSVRVLNVDGQVQYDLQ